MREKGFTGYELSRDWFDFAYENPDLVGVNEAALYMWLIEKNNRCGWSIKLSITSTENMRACGFKTYPPYKKAYDKLVELGFIKVIVPSINQYKSNVIALSKNNKALEKALDKARLRHVISTRESTRESTFDINKTSKQVNNKTIKPKKESEIEISTHSQKIILEERKKDFYDSVAEFKTKYKPDLLRKFYDYWTEPNKSQTKMRFEMQKTWSLDLRLKTWASREVGFKTDPQKTNYPQPKILKPSSPQAKQKVIPPEQRWEAITSGIEKLYSNAQRFNDMGSSFFNHFKNLGLVDDVEPNDFQANIYANQNFIQDPDIPESERELRKQSELKKLREEYFLKQVVSTVPKEQLLNQLKPVIFG